MNEQRDRLPTRTMRATPVFPGGFGLEVEIARGERFSSLDSMVGNFWGRTKNLLISLDYHDTLTTPGQKTIPAPSLQALQQQARRLHTILGSSVDVVVNTIGPFRQLETATGLPVIANSGLDLQESPTGPVVPLFPEKEAAFTEIRDRAAARLTGQGRSVELVSRNDRASFIPLSDGEISPEDASELVHQVIPEGDAAGLRIFVNTGGKKISISPGVFKQDGAAAFITKHGKDPASTAYIHMGDDSGDIPMTNSPFGRTYFLTPGNTIPEVKEYGAYNISASAPDAAPVALQEIADAVGKRILIETIQTLSSDSDIETHIAAADNVKRWVGITAGRLIDAFHTIPTTDLIFHNLQTLFGTSITQEQRHILANAVIDSNHDTQVQIARLAGVDDQDIRRQYDEHAFDDHPLARSDGTYPGMKFLATRGAGVREPVLTDSLAASAEYENQALENSARLTQQLTEKLLEAFGEDMRDVVLMSIYRGGTYPSIGLQQLIKTSTGMDIPHYSVIPHKLNEARTIEVKGEQKRIQYTLSGEELEYVLDQHPDAKIVFVDGWVGSGQTIVNLRDVLTMKKEAGGFKNDFYFASLLDPLGITDFAATTTDHVMGWNLWPYNDYTYGFYHKNNQPGNNRLLTVTPDSDSFDITQARLQQWLSHIDAVGENADQEKIPQTLPVPPEEYIRKAREVAGFSAEDFDMARVKLGVNEAFIRIRNDNGGFWKFLVVHSGSLEAPEIRKTIEVAQHRGVRVFHSAELPCLALLSQDPFTNPNVLENEIDVTRGNDGPSPASVVYTA